MKHRLKNGADRNLPGVRGATQTDCEKNVPQRHQNHPAMNESQITPPLQQRRHQPPDLSFGCHGASPWPSLDNEEPGRARIKPVDVERNLVNARAAQPRSAGLDVVDTHGIGVYALEDVDAYASSGSVVIEI
jgi:hypothetical protein